MQCLDAQLHEQIVHCLLFKVLAVQAAIIFLKCLVSMQCLDAQLLS